MKRKKQKLNPEIFRRAAAFLETGESHYACGGINHAVGFNYRSINMYINYFAKWFQPHNKRLGETWFGPYYGKKARRDRIIALLLCADILQRQNNKK